MNYRMLFLSLSAACGFFLFSTGAQAYTAVDYANAGNQLYQAKNYPQAIQYFNAALQMDPNNTAAFQGRGSCYYMQGQYAQALDDYQKAQALNPTLQRSWMIQNLQARLAPSAAPTDIPTPQAQAPKPAPKKHRFKSFYGLEARFNPGFATLHLSDLNANTQYMQQLNKIGQGIDPSYAYNGSAAPSLSANLELELDKMIGSDFEAGVMFSVMPMGTVSDSVTNSSNYSFTDSFGGLFTLAAGLGCRFYFTQEDIRPWVAASPFVLISNTTYNYDLNKGGSTVTFGGPMAGVGFGGQAQVGVDLRLGDSLILSVFGGYQAGSVSHFKGQIGNSNVSGITSGSDAVLQVVPTSAGNTVVPVANGLLCVATADSGAGAAAPANSRDMVLDISGVQGGISVGWCW